MSWENSLKITASSYQDFYELAKKRLPKQLFQYICAGSGQQQTLANNQSQLSGIRLRQKVLTDVSQSNCRCSLFGQPLKMPLVMAPVGLAGLFAQRAEKQAAKVAKNFGIPFSLSTVGVCSIDEVAAVQPANCWFQLYLMKDRIFCADLLQRVWATGCRRLILTVDMPILADRTNDVRNGVSEKQLNSLQQIKRGWDILSHPRWLWDVAIQGRPLTFGNLQAAVPNGKRLNDFKCWIDKQFDPSVSWSALEWLRTHWQGEIILKGIMTTEDAKIASDNEINGIVVSNHGGRQLDGAPAAIEALPEIADQVGDKLTVLFDSGIQSGTDIFRALALGADGCMIGRGWILAMASQGEKGLARYLNQLHRELITAMMLTGCSQLSEIDRNRLL